MKVKDSYFRSISKSDFETLKAKYTNAAVRVSSNLQLVSLVRLNSVHLSSVQEIPQDEIRRQGVQGMQDKTLNDSCHPKLIYVLYNPVSDNDNKTTGHPARMYHNPPPSNYPVFIVGSDWLSTKQPILAVIDPLIGKWPIVVKGLGNMDRQEEMEA